MNNTTSNHSSKSITPQDLLQAVIEYRFRWIVPTAVITLLALGYVCMRPAVWEASQSLLVRDEAAGSLARPGRFADIAAMKIAQETILELIKSRSVAEAALREVGPAAGKRVSSAWPTSKDVEAFQSSIKVSAPGGAEFGSTEVFYVKVKNKNPQRAILLTQTICDQLDSRLQQLRNNKALSLVDELTKTVAIAQADLDQSTERLSKVEQQVGGDLGELRILNESASGESNLRQTLIAVKREMRELAAARQTDQQLLELLHSAQGDSQMFLAAPNRLLQSQPALKQLKDGLVASKLRTAELLGNFTEQHPKVLAALAAQNEIRNRLHEELQTSILGLQAELKLNAGRIATLQEQLDDVNGRMIRLAGLRAGYSNLSDDVSQRSETLKNTQQDLAAARASQAAAHSASLVTRLDSPNVGSQPKGPRRAIIVFCGLAGGLATGLGLVFLTAPITAKQGKSALKISSIPVKKQIPAASGGLSLREALATLYEPKPSWN